MHIFGNFSDELHFYLNFFNLFRRKKFITPPITETKISYYIQTVYNFVPCFIHVSLIFF